MRRHLHVAEQGDDLVARRSRPHAVVEVHRVAEEPPLADAASDLGSRQTLLEHQGQHAGAVDLRGDVPGRGGPGVAGQLADRLDEVVDGQCRERALAGVVLAGQRLVLEPPLNATDAAVGRGAVASETGVVDLAAQGQGELLGHQASQVDDGVLNEAVGHAGRHAAVLRGQQHVVGRHVAGGRLGVVVHEVRGVAASSARYVERVARHRDHVGLLRDRGVLVHQTNHASCKRLRDKHSTLGVVVARQRPLFDVPLVPRTILGAVEQEAANPATADLGIVSRSEATDAADVLHLASDRSLCLNGHRLGRRGNLATQAGDLLGDGGFLGEPLLELGRLSGQLLDLGHLAFGAILDLGQVVEHGSHSGCTVLELVERGGHPWHSRNG